MMIKMLPGKIKPPTPPAVDLSHLTEEEREVIQKVIDRQKALEDETFKIERNLTKELEVYEIKCESTAKSLQPARTPSKNICTICQRTKFSETVSPKICKYCKQQTCFKCGEQISATGVNKGSQGHLSFFSSVVQDLKALTSGVEATWTCLICRKKQELLAKTGTWFHGKELVTKDPVKQIELGIKNSPPVTPSKQQSFKHAITAKSIASGLYSGSNKKGLVRSNSDETNDSKSDKQNVRNHVSSTGGQGHGRPSLRRSKSLDQSPLTERSSREAKFRGQGRDSPNTFPKKKSVTFGDNKQFDAGEVQARKPKVTRDSSDVLTVDVKPQPSVTSAESKAKEEPEMAVNVSPRLASYESFFGFHQTVNQKQVLKKRESFRGSLLRRSVSFDSDASYANKKGILKNNSKREWTTYSFDESSPPTVPLMVANEELQETAKASSHVRWSPPDEDHKIIGDIFLSMDASEVKEYTDHCALFGFRILGGQRKTNGKLCTVINEVFPESFADRVAQLHPGDEIIEWNEQSLVDCSADEVQDIISSDDSLDLHLVVSRECRTQPSQVYESAPDNGIFSPSDGLRGDGSPRTLQDAGPDMDVAQLEELTGASQRMPCGILKQTSGRPQDQFSLRDGLSDEEGSPKNAYQTQLQQMPSSSHVAGRLQVKLWYDKETGNLYVTVLGADGLLPRENNQLRNPYVKLYFLPDRSLQSKRRTKTVLRTVSPRWNQTFMYMCKYQKLQGRALEFTVWDYDRFEVNEFIGEVVLDMAEVCVDNMAHSYPLTMHNYEVAPLPAPTPLTSPRGSFREKEKPTVVVRTPADREPDSDSGLGSVENMDGALPRQPTGDEMKDSVDSYDSAYQHEVGNQYRTHRDHGPHDDMIDHNARTGHSINGQHQQSIPSGQYADCNSYPNSTLDRNATNYNMQQVKSIGMMHDPSQMGEGMNYGIPGQGPYDGFSDNKPTLLQRASQFIQQQLQPLNTVFDIKSQQKTDTSTTVTTAVDRTPGGEAAPGADSTVTSSSRGVSPYRQMPLVSLENSQQEGQYLLKTVSPAQRYRQYQQGMYQQQLSQAYGPETPSSQRRKYSHSIEDQYRAHVDDKGFLQLPGHKSSQGHSGSHSSIVSRPGAGRRASVGTIMPTSQGGSSRDYSYSGSSRMSPAVDRKHHHRTLPSTSGRQPLSDSERDDAIRRQINDLKLGRTHSAGRHDRIDRSMYDSRLGDPSQMMHPALATRRTSSTSKLQGRSNSSDNIKLSNSVGHGGYVSHGHGSLRSQGRSRSSSALPATEYQMHPAFYGMGTPADNHMPYDTMSDSGSIRPRRRRDSGGRISPTSSVTSELSTRSGSSSSIASSITLTSIDSSPWISNNLRIAGDSQFADFVEGLGPAQMVGRQVLGVVWPGDSKHLNNSRTRPYPTTYFSGSPHMGDIQISLFDRRGTLEVEIIRARGLVPKPGSKTLPAPYVKVYVMDGKRCVLKKKTKTARRTLDPLYQQQLEFPCDYIGKTLQVMVWGDYGRIERKVFMGVCQILLDDLDLSQLVIGWYKLFSTATLCQPPLSGGSSVRGSDREDEY